MSLTSAAALAVLAGATSSAQAAWHIHPNQLPEVRRLVNQIEGDSRQAAQEAQRYADWNNPREQQGVRALLSLNDSARDLDRVVQTSWVDPQQVDFAFGKVDRDANQVQGALPHLRAYQANRWLFDRLTSSVVSLRMIRGGTTQQPGNPQLRRQAQELATSSKELIRRTSFESQRNPWDQRQAGAVRDAQVLAREADVLVQLLRGGLGSDPRRVHQQIARIQQSWERVRLAVPQARFSRSVLEAFNLVSRDVTDLARSASGPRPPRPLIGL